MSHLIAIKHLEKEKYILLKNNDKLNEVIMNTSERVFESKKQVIRNEQELAAIEAAISTLKGKEVPVSPVTPEPVIIGGSPACGKTTELVRKASKENLYIVCATNTIAEVIYQTAKQLNLIIPYPITAGELPLNPGGSIKKILVDDVELVLQVLLGYPVDMVSTSLKMKNLLLPFGGKEVEKN